MKDFSDLIKGPKIVFFTNVEHGQKMLGMHCIRVVPKIFAYHVMNYFEDKGSFFFHGSHFTMWLFHSCKVISVTPPELRISNDASNIATTVCSAAYNIL